MPSKSQNLPSSISSIRNSSRADSPAFVRRFRCSVTEAASKDGKIAASPATAADSESFA